MYIIFNGFNLCVFLSFFADREKRPVNSGSGDESSLPKNQDLSGLYGAAGTALKSTSLSNIYDDADYVPTVGRWGSEWPSWLAANSFGEQALLCYRPRSIVGVNQLPETDKTDDDFVEKLTVAAGRLQCSVKWTIDADTYNLDAFDQCEGAWPIGHPLPLPSWSNEIKAPLIVEKVSKRTSHYSRLDE